MYIYIFFLSFLASTADEVKSENGFDEVVHYTYIYIYLCARTDSGALLYDSRVYKLCIAFAGRKTRGGKKMPCWCKLFVAITIREKKTREDLHVYARRFYCDDGVRWSIVVLPKPCRTLERQKKQNQKSKCNEYTYSISCTRHDVRAPDGRREKNRAFVGPGESLSDASFNRIRGVGGGGCKIIRRAR